MGRNSVITSKLEATIINIKDFQLNWGKTRINRKVRECGFYVGDSTIYEILKCHHLTLPPKRELHDVIIRIETDLKGKDWNIHVRLAKKKLSQR